MPQIAGGQRALTEQSHKVWKAIAGAGHRGIVTRALYERFSGELAEEAINGCVESLKYSGYIERKGVNRYGYWVITQDCKVPKGEEAPLWLTEPMDADDTVPVQPSAPVKTTAAPSVFHLGQQGAAPKLRNSTPANRAAGVRKVKAAKAFDKATASPPAPLGWSLPLSKAHEASAEPAAPAPAAGVDIDKMHHCLASRGTNFGDEVPGALVGGVAPALPTVSGYEFLCSLNSEGHLFILSDGRDMEIPRDNVHKLFRYLDLVRGTEPSKLMGSL